MHLYNVTACDGTVLITGHEFEREVRFHVIWADARKPQ
jgi:hypothetical protein